MYTEIQIFETPSLSFVSIEVNIAAIIGYMTLMKRVQSQSFLHTNTYSLGLRRNMKGVGGIQGELSIRQLIQHF